MSYDISTSIATGQICEKFWFNVSVGICMTRRPLRIASINALYQLVQKDGLVMSKLGGDGLVEDLFGLLGGDQSVQQGGVRNALRPRFVREALQGPRRMRDDEGEFLSVGGEDATSGAS
jgi:hypothetical protein